jgi:hypothetical protein
MIKSSTPDHATGAVKHYGLSDEDCEQITTRSRRLPGRWTVRLEVMEDGLVFARLIAPWVDMETSAFLLERELNQIVLTDRLSSGIHDSVSRHETIADALDTARTVLRGPSGVAGCVEPETTMA